MRETPILRACMAAASALGCLPLRNNVGQDKVTHVRYGLGNWGPCTLGNGGPDLWIFEAGFALGIETKSPDGRLSPAQLTHHAVLARHGMPVAVARDASEAAELIARWRAARR